MRQDQYEKLQKLHEQLIDAFLFEADPAKWPGVGNEPANWDQTTRGDRYWCKKNAVATASVIGRVDNLVQKVQGLGTTAPIDGQPAETPEDEEAMLDTEIATFEKEAAKVLAKVQAGARGNGKS